MYKEIKHIKDVKFLYKLMQIAIADARATMKVEGFQAHGAHWYSDDAYPKVCSFCLAGATIARDLNFSTTAGTRRSYDYDRETKNRLLALDNVRRGDWTNAFIYMHYRENSNVADQAKVFTIDATLKTPRYGDFDSNEMLSWLLDDLDMVIDIVKRAELKALRLIS